MQARQVQKQEKTARSNSVRITRMVKDAGSGDDGVQMVHVGGMAKPCSMETREGLWDSDVVGDWTLLYFSVLCSEWNWLAVAKSLE